MSDEVIGTAKSNTHDQRTIKVKFKRKGTYITERGTLIVDNTVREVLINGEPVPFELVGDTVIFDCPEFFEVTT